LASNQRVGSSNLSGRTIPTSLKSGKYCLSSRRKHFPLSVPEI